MEKKDLIQKLTKCNFPESIVKAFEKIDRKKFVSEIYSKEVYEDIPLPIGFGQTISQPYTIAFMLTLLELEKNKKMKILEVGSGSGYVLELLSELKKDSQIYGIEIVSELVKNSKRLLRNKENVKVLQAKKGKLGLLEESKKEKFDRILISASSSKIPSELIKQLKIGGVLVAPVRDSIIKIKKFANENKVEKYPGFVFVPLIE